MSDKYKQPQTHVQEHQTNKNHRPCYYISSPLAHTHTHTTTHSCARTPNKEDYRPDYISSPHTHNHKHMCKNTKQGRLVVVSSWILAYCQPYRVTFCHIYANATFQNSSHPSSSQIHKISPNINRKQNIQ